MIGGGQSQVGIYAVGLTIVPILPTALARAPSVPAANRTELSHACSRLISRNVRKRLDKDILKPARQELAIVDAWPSECPFDPAKDLYLRQEKQKQHKRTGGHGHSSSWTCGLCGKAFKSEHYLDLHMERGHMDATPVNGVCLADYCEVFDACSLINKARREKEKICENETMAVAREHCTTAMTKCFPLKQEVSRRLYAQNNRHWCQVLDCRVREHRKREEDNAHMPAIVLVILICLTCFVFFICMIYCVDYSDNVMQTFKDYGFVTDTCLRRFRKTRDEGRKNMGMPRMRDI